MDADAFSLSLLEDTAIVVIQDKELTVQNGTVKKASPSE